MFHVKQNIVFLTFIFLKRIILMFNKKFVSCETNKE